MRRYITICFSIDLLIYSTFFPNFCLLKIKLLLTFLYGPWTYVLIFLWVDNKKKNYGSYASYVFSLFRKPLNYFTKRLYHLTLSCALHLYQHQWLIRSFFFNFTHSHASARVSKCVLFSVYFCLHVPNEKWCWIPFHVHM